MTETIGSLVISLDGLDLSSEEKELLQHPLITGVILFTRNFESKTQLANLCRQIRASRKRRTFILVDQEGGRVQRFKGDFKILPPMGSFGAQYQSNPLKACSDAQAAGACMAKELLDAGVDLSLAPVLDVNRQMNTVIGDRAFHTDPDTVIRLSLAFMQGMRQAGMASVGKHFPGHGSVTIDSHVGMPVDNRPLSQVVETDLLPFKAMIREKIPALMAAHIVFPEVDDKPVGFSAVWLKQILREQLHFHGVIVSDDLNMEGANISSNYADRVHAAHDAGCDLLLLCNQRAGVIQAVDQLSVDDFQLKPQQMAMLLPQNK